MHTCTHAYITLHIRCLVHCYMNCKRCSFRRRLTYLLSFLLSTASSLQHMLRLRNGWFPIWEFHLFLFGVCVLMFFFYQQLVLHTAQIICPKISQHARKNIRKTFRCGTEIAYSRQTWPEPHAEQKIIGNKRYHRTCREESEKPSYIYPLFAGRFSKFCINSRISADIRFVLTCRVARRRIA